MPKMFVISMFVFDPRGFIVESFHRANHSLSPETTFRLSWGDGT
jgi:hypothetical protein